MLGIAWGIVTVVILMAYGNGFHNALVFGFRGAFSDGTVVVSQEHELLGIPGWAPIEDGELVRVAPDRSVTTRRIL